MRCRRCDVNLIGNHKHCPLCQGELDGAGNPDENVFPVITTKKIQRTLVGWITFLTILISTICVVINVTVSTRLWWSLFVIGGMGSLWLFLVTLLKKRKNIPKTILWQTFIVCALSLLWDYFTGYYRWSVNFVIPIVCTCALIALALAAKILRMRLEEFMIYIILTCILGLISYLFILFGMVTFVYPTAVCFCSSILSLGLLVFLEGRALWAELSRRMHV